MCQQWRQNNKEDTEINSFYRHPTKKKKILKNNTQNGHSQNLTNQRMQLVFPLLFLCQPKLLIMLNGVWKKYNENDYHSKIIKFLIKYYYGKNKLNFLTTPTSLKCNAEVLRLKINSSAIPLKHHTSILSRRICLLLKYYCLPTKKHTNM